MWDLATAGKYDEAVMVYRWYTPLLHLDTHQKLVQYIKLANQIAGEGKEWVRPPRLPADLVLSSASIGARKPQRAFFDHRLGCLAHDDAAEQLRGESVEVKPAAAVGAVARAAARRAAPLPVSALAPRRAPHAPG